MSATNSAPAHVCGDRDILDGDAREGGDRDLIGGGAGERRIGDDGAEMVPRWCRARGPGVVRLFETDYYVSSDALARLYGDSIPRQLVPEPLRQRWPHHT